MVENEIRDNFGAILARERRKENRSLKDLAEMLGYNEEGKYNITPSYLNRLEKGEKANPSFWMVCLMIDKLNLNIREVFKSFGFESILPSNINSETDSVEEIIRLSNIKATLSPNEEGLKSYLSQEEKEALLSIINDVFNYGVCHPEDEAYYIGEVIGGLELFRFQRMKYYEKSFEVTGEEYKLKFDRNIKSSLNKIGIEDEQIFDIVQDFNDKLLNKEGKFIVRSNKLGITIVFNKSGNTFTILDVSDEYEEV